MDTRNPHGESERRPASSACEHRLGFSGSSFGFYLSQIKISSSIQPSYESSSCVCTKTAFLFPLAALCHVFSIVLLQCVVWVWSTQRLQGLNWKENQHWITVAVVSTSCMPKSISGLWPDLTRLDLLWAIHECVAPPRIHVLHVLQNEKRMKVSDWGGTRQCASTLF